MDFNASHVGSYVRDNNGRLFKILAYADRPTVTFQQVDPPPLESERRVTFCVGSPAAGGYKLLTPASPLRASADAINTSEPAPLKSAEDGVQWKMPGFDQDASKSRLDTLKRLIEQPHDFARDDSIALVAKLVRDAHEKIDALADVLLNKRPR